MIAFHLGLRWLLRRRSAWLAAAAVVLTVTVSIAVMGVVQGFVEVMDRQVRANESDLTLQPGFGMEGLEDSPGYRQFLLEAPGVIGVAPSISGFALAVPRWEHATARPSDGFPVLFDGIEWEADQDLGRLPAGALHRAPALDLHTPPLTPDRRGTGFLTPQWRERLAWQGGMLIDGLGPLPLPPVAVPPAGAVLGQELAYFHGLLPGSGEREGHRLTLSIPNARGGLVGRVEVEVSDTLGTGIYEVDRYNCLLPLPLARRLAGFSGGPQAPALVSAYRIDLEPELDVDLGARVVAAHTQENVETWRKRRSHLIKGALQQRNLLGFVMILVQVLAVFIVYASFSTMVVEKRRDLGVLIGLGTRPIRIASAFLFAAIVCCVGGGLLGWGLGWAVLAGLNPFSQRTGIVFFPQEFFYSPETPISFNPLIPLTYIAIMTVIGILAALLPAWRASRVDPVEILREGT